MKMSQAAAACALVALCACARREEPILAGGDPRHPRTVETRMESLDLLLDLPPGVVRHHLGKQEAFCVERELNQRYGRCLVIDAADSIPQSAKSWRSAAFTERGRFYYLVEPYEMGSSPPEDMLTAYGEIGGRAYRMTVNAGSKWCMPIISSLRPAAR
jgi:hypothetical protein